MKGPRTHLACCGGRGYEGGSYGAPVEGASKLRGPVVMVGRRGCSSCGSALVDESAAGGVLSDRLAWTDREEAENSFGANPAGWRAVRSHAVTCRGAAKLKAPSTHPPLFRGGVSPSFCQAASCRCFGVRSS